MATTGMKPGTGTASYVLSYKEHRHEGHGTRGSVMGRRTYRTPARQSTWNEQHDAGTMGRVDDDREQTSRGKGVHETSESAVKLRKPRTELTPISILRLQKAFRQSEPGEMFVDSAHISAS
ncbi:hypothetical protein CEP54_010331 [Fusarium duplospermum]|uniref:Uncharacterized protein n=1 Tax=Fusarium duplospermum TaxID=1325734 RepID=A0A428PKQ3_9HYPO|nr:hypothetical protein CEP54_010331 [Fusarium duplospermum]